MLRWLIHYLLLRHTVTIVTQFRRQCVRVATNLVGVHDTEGFLELLDGALGEHGEDIAAALLGFPATNKIPDLCGPLRTMGGVLPLNQQPWVQFSAFPRNFYRRAIWRHFNLATRLS